MAPASVPSPPPPGNPRRFPIRAFPADRVPPAGLSRRRHSDGRKHSDAAEDGAARAARIAPRVPAGHLRRRRRAGDVVGNRRATGRGGRLRGLVDRRRARCLLHRQRCRRARRRRLPPRLCPARRAHAVVASRTPSSAPTASWATTASPTTPPSCSPGTASSCCRRPAATARRGSARGSEHGLRHWFWPLDAEVGADGHLWLFLAEVHNPNGERGRGRCRAGGDVAGPLPLPDLELVDLEPAADASRSLFGYSIVSDDAWTYLFGHCYRQFVGEARAPTGSTRPARRTRYVARVPARPARSRAGVLVGCGLDGGAGGPPARAQRPALDARVGRALRRRLRRGVRR